MRRDDTSRLSESDSNSVQDLSDPTHLGFAQRKAMKIEIVLDRALPLGLLANAVAVLAFSASKNISDGVEQEVVDADGGIHKGITKIPIPILACDGSLLPGLRLQAAATEGVECIDFCDVAQRAKRYDEYVAKLERSKNPGLNYLGICIFGESAKVKHLMAHLSLLTHCHSG
jgi:hypothetical protein